MVDLIEFPLVDADATVALGSALADAISEVFSSQTTSGSLMVFLKGNLGAGKTTFSRGVIQALGHTGAVKSPTYTLVEPYEALPVPVFHFDLYRLSDPEELEFMGFRDYLDQSALLLIEWPSKGAGFLPDPDMVIEMHIDESQSPPGRVAKIQAFSQKARMIVRRVSPT